MSKIKLTTELAKELLDMLPHGSGIDYDWQFSQTKDHIVATNGYHHMDENGYYDGISWFAVKFPRNEPLVSWVVTFKLSFINQSGYHRRKYNFTREYLIGCVIDEMVNYKWVKKHLDESVK